jgi:hypothetical protein
MVTAHPGPEVPAGAQGQARECHRRSHGRAIAPAWSPRRRWMAGLALSPAPGSGRVIVVLHRLREELSGRHRSFNRVRGVLFGHNTYTYTTAEPPFLPFNSQKPTNSTNRLGLPAKGRPGGRAGCPDGLRRTLNLPNGDQDRKRARTRTRRWARGRHECCVYTACMGVGMCNPLRRFQRHSTSWAAWRC